MTNLITRPAKVAAAVVLAAVTALAMTACNDAAPGTQASGDANSITLSSWAGLSTSASAPCAGPA